jgi:hypothetical protein
MGGFWGQCRHATHRFQAGCRAYPLGLGPQAFNWVRPLGRLQAQDLGTKIVPLILDRQGTNAIAVLEAWPAATPRRHNDVDVLNSGFEPIHPTYSFKQHADRGSISLPVQGSEAA